MSALTAPQARLLAEIREAGVKVYNGRLRRTIKALEDAGLVSVDWDMVPHAKGSGMTLSERITVRPVVTDLEARWKDINAQADGDYNARAMFQFDVNRRYIRCAECGEGALFCEDEEHTDHDKENAS